MYFTVEAIPPRIFLAYPKIFSRHVYKMPKYTVNSLLDFIVDSKNSMMAHCAGAPYSNPQWWEPIRGESSPGRTQIDPRNLTGPI